MSAKSNRPPPLRRAYPARVDVVTRSETRDCDREQWDALRARYGALLLDLGCGEGGHVRRFAREHPDWLAVGLDIDRDALRRAAQRAARRPERGGAPNTLFVAADAQRPPQELLGAAQRLTVHFPWSALLRLILEDAPAFAALADQLCADQAELELILNAEAAPPGCQPPTPDSLQAALREPLERARFTIQTCDWLNPEDAPPTRWAGRLVKGSRRAAVALTASR